MRTPAHYVAHIIQVVDKRCKMETGFALSPHAVAIVKLFFWIRDAMAANPAPSYED